MDLIDDKWVIDNSSLSHLHTPSPTSSSYLHASAPHRIYVYTRRSLSLSKHEQEFDIKKEYMVKMRPLKISTTAPALIPISHPPPHLRRRSRKIDCSGRLIAIRVNGSSQIERCGQGREKIPKTPIVTVVNLSLYMNYASMREMLSDCIKPICAKQMNYVMNRIEYIALLEKCRSSRRGWQMPKCRW